nr:RHO alpha subunit C-terminal catalytic domain-containing protein [Hoeflea alexandrii]
MKAITWRWPIPRFRICTAGPISMSPLSGACRDPMPSATKTAGRWSVRNYLKLMQPRPNMPEHLKRAWVYYGLFPNAVIAVTPELVQFYQEFPLSTGETLLRGSIYRYRDETRQQTLARKLAIRIDNETMGEDVRLTEWSNEAMNSSAFKGFYLSDLEYGVRSHHDHLRAVLPVSKLDERPSEDDVARLNEEMATGT